MFNNWQAMQMGNYAAAAAQAQNQATNLYAQYQQQQAHTTTMSQPQVQQQMPVQMMGVAGSVPTAADLNQQQQMYQWYYQQWQLQPGMAQQQQPGMAQQQSSMIQHAYVSGLY
jgi:hypothetical protein